MSNREYSFKKKAMLGAAGLSLVLAQIACGGASKVDPCDEAFEALTTAFSQARPGVVKDKTINVWPANPDGSPSHPRIPSWQGKTDRSWREVASYLRFECEDTYKVKSLAMDQDERFYDDGVTISKKPVRAFSLPEVDPNLVKAAMTSLVAVLGLGALGLGGFGAKKVVSG